MKGDIMDAIKYEYRDLNIDEKTASKDRNGLFYNRYIYESN